jgi:predicted MPP superfamily phosphohydrolase
VNGTRRRLPLMRIAVAVLLLALAIWTVVIEPRWVAARVEPLSSAQWQAPAGLKVAVAGDWHLTARSVWRITSVDRAARIVDEINAAKPDVILLPGDFLAGSGDDETLSIEEMAAVLGRLKAPQGVYAVLGNHDWWHDGERTAKALSAQGIRALENASVRLPGHATHARSGGRLAHARRADQRAGPRAARMGLWLDRAQGQADVRDQRPGREHPAGALQHAARVGDVPVGAPFFFHVIGFDDRQDKAGGAAWRSLRRRSLPCPFSNPFPSPRPCCASAHPHKRSSPPRTSPR